MDIFIFTTDRDPNIFALLKSMEDILKLPENLKPWKTYKTGNINENDPAASWLVTLLQTQDYVLHPSVSIRKMQVNKNIFEFPVSALISGMFFPYDDRVYEHAIDTYSTKNKMTDDLEYKARIFRKNRNYSEVDFEEITNIFPAIRDVAYTSELLARQSAYKILQDLHPS